MSSDPTFVFKPAIRRLKRQAAESIHEETVLLTVVRGFDLSTAEVYEDGETEWNARYDYTHGASVLLQGTRCIHPQRTPQVPRRRRACARSASIPSSSQMGRRHRAGPRSVAPGASAFPSGARRSSGCLPERAGNV